MYLHKQKKKNGDIYLSIKEKYHVPKVGSRERTIESIGYLSKLKEQYDDPVKYFTQYAKELTERKKAEKTKDIKINMAATIDINTCDTRNVGYGILKYIYRELEIDKFWNWKTKNSKMEFSTDQIFRLLTLSRALQPGSKRYTLNNRNFFFEPFEGFQLEDVYRALDIFSENDKDFQQWLYDHSCTKYNRDMSVSYFDCTNYYWDVSKPDCDEYNDDGSLILVRYRKMGPEKNNRKDPIVELGLLLDKTCIPLAYDLFPGNDSEKLHLPSAFGFALRHDKWLFPEHAEVNCLTGGKRHVLRHH